MRGENNIKRSATYQGNNLTNVYTPAQLSAKIKLQDFSGVNIGDYFEITLTNGEEAIIEVSGFNANIMQGDSVINSNPHITMTFRDCIQTAYRMNETETNAGGYAGSVLANTVNTTIFNLLPSEWKAIIMPTRRLEPNKGIWIWATRNMWLLTEVEVFGHNNWGEPGYGSGGQMQLPIFAHSFRHIVKGFGKNAAERGSRCYWWLASPRTVNDIYFCRVGQEGDSNYGGANNLHGVAPAFNIY